MGLKHPGLAIATVRAGGVGILDGEFCQDSVQASQALEKLLSLTVQPAAVGLRVRLDQIGTYLPLLSQLQGHSYWLILSAWETAADLESISSQLPAHPSRKLLLEVTDVAQVSQLPLTSPDIAGLVARGHEAGGWVGEDSAFILLQKLIKSQTYPIYVQGGIGIHTAAACRAVGAAGVVLDDQLWLMPESPLPEDWQQHLRNLSGQEAIVIGERLTPACRVLSRPGFQAISALQKLADQVELAPSGEAPSQFWPQPAQALIGWDEPGLLAWPIGQAVGLAITCRDRYQTTGRLIQALLKASETHLKTAEQLRPLQADSPLALSHGTEYPIVQGPMTRVSDTPEFANAVSQSGGLPLLALALMPGTQVKPLLHKTKELLGDRSWGIGILGFVSHALREEQIAAISEVKPPFALIAGGRPDQAAQFEAQGIATYIHVPAPRLLKMFLEQGAKRFVFEGRECGGHVGPLSSFVLWESMITMLLEDVPAAKASEIHVLFAGGIHDAHSAAMVSAMAAPLVERGIQIGVLMGTAYLFTQEAVDCGAILPGFQEQALACSHTINLETGPGHASRCAITPFAQEFYATRRKMMVAGNSSDEVKNTLEDLTLGRLRIASKGLTRSQDGQIVNVEPTRQLESGMYMIGQVATLRQQVCTIRELHQDVAEVGAEVLQQNSPSQPTDSPTVSPSDIAIIGIGTLLPRAQDPQTFWSNILAKVDAITEIPAHRWDWRLYYDADRHARDKVYSKWGGFIDEIPFDPMRFGIPPNSLRSIEPVQLMVLEVVQQALEDAGYGSGNFDRENTSVILGAGGGVGDLGGLFATRSEIPRIVDAPNQQLWERLPEWTEETFSGILMNVAAGRVANRFDFGGSNFTVDAACASSLASIDLAVKELESGRSNVAIAGGIDAFQSPFTYFCFSKTQALSPRGRCRTFDKSADGIAISEGIAVVILKRLTDAERDGDRIYGVIKAVAASSDGRALGMTAPLPAGQMRALKRAYHKAGFQASTLGMYEAHGTGTAVGDKAELETIQKILLSESAPSKSCMIGSVKTMIGHTKCSAGVSGLIKTVLSMYHQVLPPHLGVEEPLDLIADPDSPVYLLKEAKPWLAHPDYPRRAGVSAFGFGGTNFHVVLEEYQGQCEHPVPGDTFWPVELILLGAENRDALVAEVQRLRITLQSGAKPKLCDLAFSYAKRAQQQNQSACICLVVENLQQLQAALEIVLDHLEHQSTAPLPPHIQINLEVVPNRGKIAFLFPGQGSQYPNMSLEVGLYFREMRQALEMADMHLHACFPKQLSQFIYPPAAYSEAEEEYYQQQLRQTQIAQPALGAISLGYLGLAARLGLQPNMVCGHSFGEYAALHAAGVLAWEDFLTLAELRGRVMASVCQVTDGAMAAVEMKREDLLAYLQGFEKIVIANHNAPLQSVISGHRQTVTQVVEQLNASGVLARILPVAGAFHSPWVAMAQAPLADAIAQTPVQPPQIPIYSNTTAHPYEADIETIRHQLATHLLSPVEFTKQIGAMYDDGARIFVELGPKRVLTNLVRQILVGKDHTVVSFDGQGGGLKGFLATVGTLILQGVDLPLTALFEERNPQLLDLARLADLTQKSELSKTARWLSGAGVRLQTESEAYPGKLPPLNHETASQAAATSKTTKVQGTQDNQSVPPSSNAEPASSSLPQSQPQPTPMTPPGSNIPVNVVPQKPMMDAQSMPTPITNPHPQTPPAVGGHTALAAYQAYQETMRMFLSCQEQVMKQFLSGGNLTGKVDLLPAGIPAPTLPVLTSPTANGNGHYSNGANGNGHYSNGANGNGHYSNGKQIGAAPLPTPPRTAQAKLESLPVVQPAAVVQPVAPPPVAVNTPAPSSSSLSATPAAATVAALPDRVSLTQRLLTLVSDRTGYPPEMLGLDQDMEAELGIDSIKRVEILGALQKSLPEPLAGSIQNRMEQFTRVKTLNGILEQLLKSLPEVKLTAVAVPGEATTLVGLPDRASLTQRLLTLVSDRTGYPPEMLGLDQDMEAELGIDSIKRVEILGALQKSLPEPLAGSIQTRMEQFTRVKTLNGILEQLLASHPNLAVAPTSTAVSAQEDERLGKPSRGMATIPRYKMEPQPEPLPELPAVALKGLFLITEDSFAVAPLVAQALQQQGANPVVIPLKTLEDSEQLPSAIAQLRQTHGPVMGIVHLAALAAHPLPETLTQWRQYTQIHVKSLFQLLHGCADDIQKAGQQQLGRVLAASLLGGYFGRTSTDSPGLPTSGGHTGLLKSLGEEWPGIPTKALDFDQHLSPSEMAQRIVQELLLPGGRTEVGYPQGERTIFKTIAAPLLTSTTPVTPDAQWVVLVTGGAQGITSEIATDLAELGVTLVITGRSAKPAPESAETEGIEDTAALRQIFLRQTQATGVSPTPALIESQIQNLRRDRTMRLSLERFRRSGAASVEYHSIDVRNPEAFGGLIEDLYRRYGRLDAVIHGAGIIEDKLIADKTADSFARVFDTKVDSTFILSRHLRPDSLQLLVLFSSVAGRYGNRGQSDYAAANEVMNRLAWKLDHQWPHTHVVSLNWGPWDSPGMASEAVKRQFRDRGVMPIPLEAGRQFFLQELRYAPKGDVEVIAGEAPWETHEAEQAALLSNHGQIDGQSSSHQLPGLVFLNTQPQLQSNSIVTLEHTFSLATDPYLQDHCLDGKPVLPAAGALEWLAEFVQAAWPEWVVTEVRDLRVLRGLVLETPAGCNVLFRARASSHADSESLQVDAEILDPDVKVVFYRASIILRPELPEPPQVKLLALNSGTNLDAEKAYLNYLFHGSRFQLLTSIGCLNPQGIDAQVVPSQPQQWVHHPRATGSWIFDPGLIDVAPQLAMVWTRVQQDVSALPAHFGAVVRYGKSPLKEPLTVALRVKDYTNQTLVYDVVFMDQNHCARLQLLDLESTCSAALNRLNLHWRTVNGLR